MLCRVCIPDAGQHIGNGISDLHVLFPPSLKLPRERFRWRGITTNLSSAKRPIARDLSPSVILSLEGGNAALAITDQRDIVSRFRPLMLFEGRLVKIFSSGKV